MTNSTELTVADVEKLVADFDANFKEPVSKDIAANDNTIKGLNEKSAERTYDLIAALVDLADTLTAELAIEGTAFRKFLRIRGQKPAREGTNPYGPFIKAVFSEQLNDTWVFENRSAEKYANHLRHLIPLKRKGTLPGTIQDYIRAYEHPTYGKKLNGIEAQDRADNPSKGATERVQSLRNTGRNAPALVNIPNTFGVAVRKVVLLYGQVNINGEVEVLKAKALNDDEADSFYYNLGREITPAK
jgi:hypothetical protein